MASINRILCPTDCSDGSRVAVTYAVYLAEQFDAEIELLHAWHVSHHIRPDLSVWMESHGQRPVTDVVQAEAEAETDKFVASLPEGARSRIQVRLVQGEAAPVILEAASSSKADLIVMGTHGRSGLAHLALGSVAERVVRSAECPVLTVRMPKE